MSASLGNEALPPAPPTTELASLVETSLAAGYERVAETLLASLALWAVEGLRAGRISPAQADQVFTALDVYLTENRGRLPALSEEAQELLLEAEHLHDAGQPFAPDLEALRALAVQLLHRAEHTMEHVR